jgi:hypothetical protein
MKIEENCAIRLVMIIAFLQMAACGDTSVPPRSASQGAPAAAAEWSGTQIRVQGTAEKPRPEGFNRIEANCVEWQDVPSVGPLVVQVPETWGVTKRSSGPRKGEIGVNIGRVGTTVGVRFEDELRAAPRREPVSPDNDVVGSVHWSGETYPVYYGNARYVSYLPVLSTDETTDVYAIVSIGGSGSGGIENIDRQEVLTVFDSMYLDRCVADSYAKIFKKVDVTFVDDE